MNTSVRLLTIIVLLCSCQCYSVLQFSDVTVSFWRLLDDHGFVNWITFLRNGTITNYDNPNAKIWDLAKGNILTFYTANKIPTCRFVLAERDYNGAWWL